MKTLCAACQGTGIGEGTRCNFGEPMNLCRRCDGEGSISTDHVAPEDRPFIAIVPISERYVCHFRVPRRKGGMVPVDVEWSPRVPPTRGRKALTARERRTYETARNTMLAALMETMGGGDYSVTQPEAAH